MQILPYIIQQTQLPSKSIENTIILLNEDATIPFISRYRKEMTGNLDEIQIGEIVKFKALFEALEKRKKAILKVLEELQVLTSELEQKVLRTRDLISLETVTLFFSLALPNTLNLILFSSLSIFFIIVSASIFVTSAMTSSLALFVVISV